MALIGSNDCEYRKRIKRLKVRKEFILFYVQTRKWTKTKNEQLMQTSPGVTSLNSSLMSQNLFWSPAAAQLARVRNCKRKYRADRPDCSSIFAWNNIHEMYISKYDIRPNRSDRGGNAMLCSNRNRRRGLLVNAIRANNVSLSAVDVTIA